MSICGVLTTKEGRPVEAAGLERMLCALALRNTWFRAHQLEHPAGFGATFPTDTDSLWNSDEVLVVCDADLHNCEELRSSLSSSPPANHPACLLGLLYLQEGVSFLDRLRGAFSVAIWDKKRKTLLLAVDRFGVKPLCYAAGAHDFVFASQPRGLFGGGRVGKKVALEAIVSYLNFTVVPLPLCAYDGVLKLPPGSYLLWQDGNARPGRYWEMEYPEDARSSTGQLARELLGRMEEAVRLASAGVPDSRLGCFLSGGTDSSSVVGLLTRLRKRPANTFSIGYGEEHFNELGYAHIAARHFHTQHTEAILGPEQALESISVIVEAYDEPFGNASAIPTYHCHRLARDRGIELMLAGDGGDELFGGNERYRTHQIYEFYGRIPRALRRGLIEPLAFGLPGSLSGIEKLRRYIEVSKTGNPERYCRWLLLQHFSPERVLAPEISSSNGHGDLLAIPRAHYLKAPARSELNRLLYLDVKMTLGDNDLPKVVRTAELAGINVRFPYLDHPLAEFSGRLPADLKVRGFEKRYLFKQATRNLLPKAILKKKKHGFGLPVGLWMKHHFQIRRMAEEVLFDPRTYQRGFFRREFIEQLFAAMDQDSTSFCGDVLWLFLMLELWYRRHVERVTS